MCASLGFFQFNEKLLKSLHRTGAQITIWQATWSSDFVLWLCSLIIYASFITATPWRGVAVTSYQSCRQPNSPERYETAVRQKWILLEYQSFHTSSFAFSYMEAENNKRSIEQIYPSVANTLVMSDQIYFTQLCKWSLLLHPIYKIKLCMIAAVYFRWILLHIDTHSSSEKS